MTLHINPINVYLYGGENVFTDSINCTLNFPQGTPEYQAVLNKVLEAESAIESPRLWSKYTYYMSQIVELDATAEITYIGYDREGKQIIRNTVRTNVSGYMYGWRNEYHDATIQAGTKVTLPATTSSLEVSLKITGEINIQETGTVKVYVYMKETEKKTEEQKEEVIERTTWYEPTDKQISTTIEEPLTKTLIIETEPLIQEAPTQSQETQKIEPLIQPQEPLKIEPLAEPSTTLTTDIYNYWWIILIVILFSLLLIIFWR